MMTAGIGDRLLPVPPLLSALRGVIRNPGVSYRDDAKDGDRPAPDGHRIGAALSERRGSGGAQSVADPVVAGQWHGHRRGGAGDGLFGALDPGTSATVPGGSGHDGRPAAWQSRRGPLTER